jgi:uncharacterized protein with GYD domain
MWSGPATALQQEDEMAKYVMLGRWTEQGARNAKDTVKRSRAAREAFAAMGVNAREWFFTLGQYDVVLTVEAPDDETMTRAALALATHGNLRTTTLRGFGEKEMEAMLSDLP